MDDVCRRDEKGRPGVTAATGLPSDLDDLMGATPTRRERHLLEILMSTLDGDTWRARVLAQEHLREFPDDRSTVKVLLGALASKGR